MLTVRDTYEVCAFRPTGKWYSSEKVSLFRVEGFESTEALWGRIVSSCGGTVPGLSTPAEECEFAIVVTPDPKNRGHIEGLSPCAVPFLVPPTWAYRSERTTRVLAPRPAPPSPLESLLRCPAFKDAAAELQKATDAFGPFLSAPEGYAILLEEVDELWDVVKKSPRHWRSEVLEPERGLPEEDLVEASERLRRRALRAEAVQVAAMALRFIRDVCDAPSEEADPTAVLTSGHREGPHRAVGAFRGER